MTDSRVHSSRAHARSSAGEALAKLRKRCRGTPVAALLGVGLRDLLLGRPLRTSDVTRERIGALTGVSLLGLDALGSSAYGPEAALSVLAPLGRVGLDHIVPITLCIVVVLAIVYVSYRQTVTAYPSGGGSYIVAKQNLGEGWGLLAAAALCVDYVLNVAVGISAGIGAIVSAVPSLHRHSVVLCLGLLTLLTVINIRGVRVSGAAWRVPTWTFVACLGVVLVVGTYKAIATGGAPQPVVAPPRVPPAVHAVTLWLLIRAFANGCAAMTGVEAVSNGVPLFRRHADALRALSTMVAILALLLIGIALLSRAYGIAAMNQDVTGYQSVLSQLTAAVIGDGWFYGLTIAAILAVLALSANTSFADFPRVCHFLAADEFLPQGFDRRGRRLVYTQGIVFLAVIAGVLLLWFRGVTNLLIPLFAVGAFMAFTLSQAGMVAHWRARLDQPRARAKMWINAVGAIVTGLTVIVLFVSKFTEGAWLTLVFVPGIVVLLHRLRARYRELDVAAHARAAIDLRHLTPPIVVVPLLGWNRAIEHAIGFAMQASPDVRAVQVLAEDARVPDLRASWETLVAEPARAAGRTPPQLDVLRSEYREVVDPIVGYVLQLAAAHPGRSIEVVVPEMFARRWYDFLVRNRYPELLRTMLLLHGGPQIVVVSAPWYLTGRGPRERRPLREQPA